MVISTQEQSGTSDVELLRRHISGEGEAFASLVRRYQRELYGFLVRFTGDATLAEDVFQAVFVYFSKYDSSLSEGRVPEVAGGGAPRVGEV